MPVKSFILGFSLCLFSLSAALACTCAPLSEQEAVSEADIIFFGTALAVRPVEQESLCNPSVRCAPIGPHEQTDFRIDKIWKGGVGNFATVSYDSLSSCEMNFELEVQYTIFANYDAEHGLVTSFCGYPDTRFDGGEPKGTLLELLEQVRANQNKALENWSSEQYK